MHDLQSLMGHVRMVWNCDPKSYPALAGMNKEQRRNFLVKHSILHIGKTLGKVATVCEAFDHNGKGSHQDEKALQTAAIKMFLNALQLADQVGLSASDLLERAPEHT